MQTIWESPRMKAKAVLPDSLPEKHDPPDQSQRCFPLLESSVLELVGTVFGAVTLGQRAWLERTLYLLVRVECRDAVLLGHVECLGALR